MIAEKTNILIVDDEPNVRLVFRTALESVGYHVEEAEDGPSALELLESSPADLVLLDLKMPGPSGLDVLRSLRDAGNDVPVAIVTAHGTIPDAVEAMKLGAIDFLGKPLTPEALRRVVGDVVRRAEDRHVQEPSVESIAGHSRGHGTTVTIGPPALDLLDAKRALNLRDFARAAVLLEQALDIDPHSPEANNLYGVLLESQGQFHTAYHAYKRALTVDRTYGPALDNIKRYCARFGLDASSPSINPGAG